MISNGEFIVSAADIVKIRCIEDGVPVFEQEPVTTVDEGTVVFVLDGMGDPKGKPVFVNKTTGEKVGEPVVLAVQNKGIAVTWTNGCAMANLIQKEGIIPTPDGRIVPVPPSITASPSPAIVLTSSSALADGGWQIQGAKDDFAASASGIVVDSIDLPTDPTTTSDTVAGEWSLNPSIGSVTGAGDEAAGSVVCLFTPDDKTKYAPLAVVVPVPVTDERAIGVTPVTAMTQIDGANANGIDIGVTEAQLSLGLTWASASGGPTVASEVVTQTIEASDGTPVMVSEAVIQALGFDTLSGERALVATLLTVPAGSVEVQVVDTESGGIGMDKDETLPLTADKLLNGQTMLLLTPVSATDNAVLRTLTFKDSEGTALLEQALTIDVSAILS